MSRKENDNSEANRFLRGGFGGLTAGGAALAGRMAERFKQLADETPEAKRQRLEQEAREAEGRRGA